MLFYCFIKFSGPYFRAAPALSNTQDSPQVEVLPQEPGGQRFFEAGLTVYNKSVANCQIFFSLWILWKSQLIGKDPDAGKDWQQEKGAAEEEMVG